MVYQQPGMLLLLCVCSWLHLYLYQVLTYIHLYVSRPVFLRVRACRRRASTASTAQHHIAQSALHKAAMQVRADQSVTTALQRKQADRVDPSQHVVQHLYSSLCSQNERRNRNLPGLPKHATIHGSFAGVRCANICLHFRSQ